MSCFPGHFGDVKEMMTWYLRRKPIGTKIEKQFPVSQPTAQIRHKCENENLTAEQCTLTTILEKGHD